jgi:hypothetical protein
VRNDGGDIRGDDVTQITREVSEALCGRPWTPITLRHLRCTLFYYSVFNDDEKGLEEKEREIAKFARFISNSADTFYTNYVYKSSMMRVREGMDIVLLANRYLSGASAAPTQDLTGPGTPSSVATQTDNGLAQGRGTGRAVEAAMVIQHNGACPRHDMMDAGASQVIAGSGEGGRGACGRTETRQELLPDAGTSSPLRQVSPATTSVRDDASPPRQKRRLADDAEVIPVRKERERISTPPETVLPARATSARPEPLEQTKVADPRRSPEQGEHEDETSSASEDGGCAAPHIQVGDSVEVRMEGQTEASVAHIQEVHGDTALVRWYYRGEENGKRSHIGPRQLVLATPGEVDTIPLESVLRKVTVGRRTEAGFDYTLVGVY